MNTNTVAHSEPPAPYATGRDDVIAQALTMITLQAKTGPIIDSPSVVKNLCRLHFANADREEFAMLFLDAQHRLLECRSLFFGTLNQTSVYPREIARAALMINAHAVVLTHNHPSGNPEPSSADIRLTKTVRDALALVDIRVLDHIVVGNPDVVSMAEKGFI